VIDGATPELRDEVLEQISVKELLAAYGVPYRKGGGRNELQAKECPRRSDHSDPVFRINEHNKRWQCFTCGTKGDVFTFIAEMERLSCRDDFPAVLARAAEIAGVVPTITPPEERAKRIDQIRTARADRERAESAEHEADDARAIAIASAYWAALPERHAVGERYLARRGCALHPAVRFDLAAHPNRDAWSSDGAPSLAIYDLRGRGISGVVRRRLPEVVAADGRGVKAPTLTGCHGNGTMANAIDSIRDDRDIVITEGIADTITALAAWIDGTVLGANGIGTLPAIIDRAARAAREHRGRLVLVPHADEKRQGEQAMIPSARHALGAGLRLGADLVVINLGGAKDLNDAWCAGWRPR
jgi:hypothetical protein